MNTVYMLHGMLGSGKSTWAKKYVKDHPDTKIVSADGFREMFNGEYAYIVELDDVITESMIAAADSLLAAGYNVIIDCGNLTKERRRPWMNLAGSKIAVVMPCKELSWHVSNRLNKPHCCGKDWNAIAEGERKSLEPFPISDFDHVIHVEEF